MKAELELDLRNIDAEYLSGSTLQTRIWRKEHFALDEFDPCELDLLYEFKNTGKVSGTFQIKDDLSEKRLLIFFNGVNSLEAEIDLTINDVRFKSKFTGQVSEYGAAAGNDFEIIVLLFDIKEQVSSVKGKVSVNFSPAEEEDYVAQLLKKKIKVEN